MGASVTICRNISNAEVEVTVDEAKCADCGTDLSFDLETNRRDDLVFTVEPCPACMKRAVDEATPEAEPAAEGGQS